MTIWYCYDCNTAAVAAKKGRCAVCNKLLHNIGNIERRGIGIEHCDKTLERLEHQLEEALEGQK
jgi:phage FluMu protein Com